NIILGLRCESEGRREDAFNAYEKALELATRARYAHMVGIAHERLARYWEKANRGHYANHHWRQAILAYRQWGADTKVDQIRERTGDADPAYGTPSFGPHP